MASQPTILVVGDSGAGKSTLVGSLAEHIARTLKKRTRLISSDGGKWDSIQYLVDAGIIEAWDIRTHQFPFETLQFACNGYWPKDVNDPKSPLEPPTPQTWEKVGALAFDSMTGKGNMFLDALSARGAKGEKIGESAPGIFKDGNASFAGANMTYYGIAQRRVMDGVESSRQLANAGHCVVMWTALQMRATDKDTNVPVFGPELVGSAKTADIPRWFGNTLGIVEWPLQAGKKERRLYLQTYFDEKNPHIPHVCKSGGIPAVVSKDVPQYISVEPVHDKPWGIGAYIELMTRKKEEASKLFGAAFLGK